MNETATASVPMNGIQKTAILLLSLGEDVSAELIKRLDDDEVRSISGAMAKTGFVTSAEMETVMIQFYRDSLAGHRVVRGGPEPTRRILSNALGADAAEKHIGETARREQKQAAAADMLQQCDPRQLAGLLRQEHPQAIALLLSRIPARAPPRCWRRCPRRRGWKSCGAPPAWIRSRPTWSRKSSA